MDIISRICKYFIKERCNHVMTKVRSSYKYHFKYCINICQTAIYEYESSMQRMYINHDGMKILTGYIFKLDISNRCSTVGKYINRKAIITRIYIAIIINVLIQTGIVWTEYINGM